MRRDVFQAIADPTRREIIGLITSKELNINEVAQNFEMSRPAVSKHMRILEQCGLVVIEKRGRERYCKPKLEPLTEVAQWIAQYRKFWNSRLDKLEEILLKEENKPDQH